jgi:hypothetical protein
MTTAVVDVTKKLTEAEAKDIFRKFLEGNPTSQVEVSSTRGRPPRVRILRPWADDSLSLTCPADEAETFANEIADLYLPPSLSAIWHAKSRELEVIWTAFSLDDEQAEIKDRKFEFKFKGKSHICRFSDSSAELNAIAKAAAMRTNSSTNFRNLQSFTQYTYFPPEQRQAFGLDRPRSFYVSNFDWEEQSSLDLIGQLNFFLTFYDRFSPHIVVHTDVDQNPAFNRYIAGKFPEKINCAGVDENLISFWLAAGSGNPLLGFILYYRVIEYAAYHFVDATFKSELKKLLSQPNMLDNLSGCIDQIAGSFSQSKIDEISRFKGVVRATVPPKLIFQEASANAKFFSKPTTFEGGFKVDSLLTKDEKEETFVGRGLDHFCDKLRKIRNTLSHGKDQESSGLITPSRVNAELLRPWTHLAAIAAGHVALFKDVS